MFKIIQSVPMCIGVGANVNWCELDWMVVSESSLSVLFDFHVVEISILYKTGRLADLGK